VPRGKRDPRRTLLNRQRAAARRLRRELTGAADPAEHPYFRDLERQLRRYREQVDVSEIVAACALTDIVYVGDFHAVPECQHFATDVLARVAARVPRLALGVEFLYTRQQRLLDARQAGTLDDEAFLKRVHYRDEWGYPWEGFGGLLDRARELDVPVYALDTPPRGGADGLIRRDEHAARRIESILRRDPDLRIVVFFGESHLARNHIPRKVKSRLKRLGIEKREVTVFQNPDSLYWRLLGENDDVPRAVRIDDTTYAVFHTSPLAKYEAYRQVLERWKGDVPPEEEVDLTPAVHHLIRVLLGWLGIRADRYRLRHRAGWVEDLADAFPEVYSGPEALELLRPILEEHGRTPEEIEEAESLLALRGALYESRSNTLFLARFLPGRAAGEAARFLRTALTGRLFVTPDEVATDPADRAYGAAYNEALAYLGARLVDPASDYLSGSEARAMAAAAGLPPRAASEHVVERVEWLEAHRRFERGRRKVPPESLLEPLRRSRSLARVLARDLGHRLGRRLFERVRDGSLEQRGLRALFIRPLVPDRAARVVTRLLRGR
jgi:uncharacterized iron-regulated protein